MYTETKIASYTHPGYRAQLLKLTEISTDGIETSYSKYQIRVNRKIYYNTNWEYDAKRHLAAIITGDLLQQKFNF